MFEYWAALYLLYGDGFDHSVYEDNDQLDILWKKYADKCLNPSTSWALEGDPQKFIENAYAIRFGYTWQFTDKFFREFNHE